MLVSMVCMRIVTMPDHRNPSLCAFSAPLRKIWKEFHAETQRPQRRTVAGVSSIAMTVSMVCIRSVNGQDE